MYAVDRSATTAIKPAHSKSFLQVWVPTQLPDSRFLAVRLPAERALIDDGCLTEELDVI